ncbi:hypothetical protein OIY81_2800 [Cryptosporidium canis]|nr:hypothetical protein OIY81_2800 [Cryptosporidium canis]
MYLEKEDLPLLNGSFFRVNLRAISQGDLRNILKACGLKSSASTSSNQHIALLEGIRRYMLTGDLSELSESKAKSGEGARCALDYKSIISEDAISAELILKSLRKSPAHLEKIMLSNSASVSEIAECCSRYLGTPRSVFSVKAISDKIRLILESLDIGEVVA